MIPWKPILLSTLCVLITSCQDPPADTPLLPSSSDEPPLQGSPSTGLALDPFEIDLNDLKIFEAGLIEEARPVLNEMTQSTIYLMDWEISSDLSTLIGDVSIRYTNREDVALEVLYFKLYPNIQGGGMSVARLSIDGSAIEGMMEREGGVLRIPLVEPLIPGAQAEISVEFTIALPLEMSGNYGLFGSFDGLLVLQQAYPIIPVYDQDGWDTDLPPSQGDLTYLDMSFYIVRVKLPEEFEVVATGRVLDHRIRDGWQTRTFAAGPVRDFYLAAGNFQQTSTTFGETVINSYILPGAKEYNDAALQMSKTAMAIFNQRLSKYPYSEFDMVSTPMLALGMEYPGVTTLNRKMYDPEAQIRDIPGTYFLESTIAHEVAHQWFYNLVGNDQIDHPWLDEALSQYLTGIYFLDTYGENAYQQLRNSWIDRWQRVEQQPTPISLPVGDYEGVAYSALVYGRGPLFVEALAEEMGEEVFWDFLQSFTETHLWEIAEPETFIAMAESQCACDLGQIWETWGVYP